MKTLFRLVREFYKKKLDNLVGNKKKFRLNKHKPHHLQMIDRLVKDIFGDISSDIKVVHKFSHFLSALIFDRSV
jgi:hypothetical protein